jgi:predicted nuclease of restriction endonuclease-like (RecB) superfamily
VSKKESEKPPALATRPPGYAEWLAELKARVHVAQQRAALAVNRELLQLYWEIGRDILERQAREGWGKGIVEQISADLRAAFPETRGFSRANLMYMRAFAEAWPDPAIVQQAVGQLPWGHNLVLLTKLKATDARVAHAEAALAHGWSRNVLAIHIENRTLERQGKALTNFERASPSPSPISLGRLSRTRTVSTSSASGRKRTNAKSKPRSSSTLPASFSSSARASHTSGARCCSPSVETNSSSIVGMTGSGKSGLVMVLVEEALRAGVPVLIFDVKGDLPNLLLSFPDFSADQLLPWVAASMTPDETRPADEVARVLAQERREGLAGWKIEEADLQAFNEKTELRVITPGGSAGEPLLSKSFEWSLMLHFSEIGAL